MCNCYDMSPGHRRELTELQRRANEAISRMDKTLNIRKTDSGITLRLVEGEARPMPMRWGFHRHFNPAVNNSRDDKLESGMWSEAWENRRCVVPISAFYEWTGPKGRKQTHAFTGQPGELLWAAGLWEENREYGPCFSIITTSANPLMAPVHDRMPGLLAFEEISPFLNARNPRELVRPFEGFLKTFTCQNPLKMKVPSPPVPMEVEQELF